MLNTFVKHSFNNKLKKLLGRGAGSGRGKTSGRGDKGQKSRSGCAIKSFEGGQTPLFRRIPKRGQKKRNNISEQIMNFHDIFFSICKGNIKHYLKLIDINQIFALNRKNKIKLLGNYSHKIQLNIETNIINKKNLNRFCSNGSIITIF